MMPIDFGVFRSLCSCPQISEGQSLHVSIALARFFLPFFEQTYPNDNRPREAIEAAEKWLADPSEENAERARRAGSKAWANACMGAIARAARAAGAAAYATDYSPWAAEAVDYNAKSKFYKIIPNGREFIKTLGRGK